MQESWTEEQRGVIAEKQFEIDELKIRGLPKREKLTRAPVPSPTPLARCRNQRFLAVALLLFVNGSNLCATAFHLFTWPDSVELSFSSDQVKVYHDANDNADDWYMVEVPLKAFPYDIALKQATRFHLVGICLINVLLLGMWLHANWRESRLEPRLAQD